MATPVAVVSDSRASEGALPQGSSLEPVKRQSSYGQILKSTALVGGSSVLHIVIGIVRTKVMAMLLGPAGFGLAGLYMSVTNLTQSVAGLGVNSSGVRQIAEAAGSGDSERISVTAAVLRRVSLALGLLGAAILALGAVPISWATFGSSAHWTDMCILALAVFCTLVSAGQGALLQGTRRIADLAKMSVLGALFGTIAAIPLVYYFRERGVAPALVTTAALTLACSWWYSRSIETARPRIPMRRLWEETAPLLKLGFAFMISTGLMMASAYLVRIIIRDSAGLAATGFYQAAWTLGGMYVGMILQAMGADFYPRLTASINDHAEANRLVNEQARASMLLAGPGVLATLTFSPLVLSVMYAPEFAAAVDVLRWICLGVAMRVISFPMGFVIMAKARQNLIILCEVAWTVVHLGLAWILVRATGVAGAGVAFFGSYVFHIGLTYVVVRNLSGFRWSSENRRTMLLYLLVIVLVFGSFLTLPFEAATLIGFFGILLSIAGSIRELSRLVDAGQAPRAFRPFLTALGFATRNADADARS